MRNLYRSLAILGTGLLVSSSARAEMRCGNRLVSKGDTLYEVRQVCGEPDHKERRTVERTVRRRISTPCIKGARRTRCSVEEERSVQIVVDEWVYDFGERRFVRYVTFEQGQLVNVRSGSYGHKEVD